MPRLLPAALLMITLLAALPAACELAQGGTAVGTGLNAPAGFAEAIAAELKEGKSEVVCEQGKLYKVSKDKKVVIHCQGGDRATIGYSLLASAGYTNVLNYSASMNEWMGLGNAVEV